MQCGYEGCPHQEEIGKRFCIYHLPTDQKGSDQDSFISRIYQLTGGPFWGRFKGFRFSAPVNFNRVPFHHGLCLDNAQFDDRVTIEAGMLPEGGSFRDTKFSGGLQVKGTVGGLFDMRGSEISGCFPDTKYGDCAFLCSDVTFSHDAFFTGATIRGGNIVFDRARFLGNKAEFKKARIFGKRITFFDTEFNTSKLNFDHARIQGDIVDFSGAKFLKGWASFCRTKWCSEETKFDGCHFAGEVTSFYVSRFLGNRTSFRDCDFTARTTDFSRMRSETRELDFTKCRLESELVSFDGARFGSCPTEISHSRVTGRLSFKAARISGRFTIDDVHFSEGSSLFITDLSFGVAPVGVPTLFFTRVQFRPFSTFFERISPGSQFDTKVMGARPLLVFRYCNLRDVYFSDNEMSLFSFFRSAFFEESFLTSSRWQSTCERIYRWLLIPTYSRRYQICEDLLFDHLARDARRSTSQPSRSEADQVDFPSHHFEVAELYVRMKSAADKAKDYHLASWFYFNEFEMKRRELCARAFSGRSTLVGLLRAALSYRLWLYNCYKVGAGYGEKPLWSALWTVFFIGLFSALHLINGLAVQSTGRAVNYDLEAINIQSHATAQFLSDLGAALTFTLTRALPTAYLPGLRVDIGCQTSGFLDFALSASNTLVLVIMVVFIAVGLKRHFRRF